MGAFFSFKIAPGVRLSASSRGLRTHVGPRFARVHVGGGRTGVSTGAGPFTAYQSLGGTARRPARTSSGPTPAQAERLREIEAVSAEFARLERLHRAEFATPAHEIAVAAKLPSFLKLLTTAEKQALVGVSRTDRAARKMARATARLEAERWAVDLMTLAESERRGKQDALDAHRAALEVNHPETVVRTLSAVFAKAGRPIRVAGVWGDDVGLVTTVPSPDIVPVRKPARTPSGASTLHQVTKTERNEWYAQVVASYLLLAPKEAFAHAPGLAAARVVAVDSAGIPLAAARIERSQLLLGTWSGGAWPVLTEVASALRFDARGRTKDLVTIDLRSDEMFGPVLSGSR